MRMGFSYLFVNFQELLNGLFFRIRVHVSRVYHFFELFILTLFFFLRSIFPKVWLKLKFFFNWGWEIVAKRSSGRRWEDSNWWSSWASQRERCRRSVASCQPRNRLWRRTEHMRNPTARCLLSDSAAGTTVYGKMSHNRAYLVISETKRQESSNITFPVQACGRRIRWSKQLAERHQIKI